jgi:hypothetical protein
MVMLVMMLMMMNEGKEREGGLVCPAAAARAAWSCLCPCL